MLIALAALENPRAIAGSRNSVSAPRERALGNANSASKERSVVQRFIGLHVPCVPDPVKVTRAAPDPLLNAATANRGRSQKKESRPAAGKPSNPSVRRSRSCPLKSNTRVLIGIITLKNRTLSPVAQFFIE